MFRCYYRAQLPFNWKKVNYKHWTTINFWYLGMTLFILTLQKRTDDYFCYSSRYWKRKHLENLTNEKNTVVGKLFRKPQGICFLKQGKSLKKDVGTLRKSFILVEWSYSVQEAMQDKRRMRKKHFTYSKFSCTLIKQEMGNSDWTNINFGILVIWGNINSI